MNTPLDDVGILFASPFQNNRFLFLQSQCCITLFVNDVVRYNTYGFFLRDKNNTSCCLFRNTCLILLISLLYIILLCKVRPSLNPSELSFGRLFNRKKIKCRVCIVVSLTVFQAVCFFFNYTSGVFILNLWSSILHLFERTKIISEFLAN